MSASYPTSTPSFTTKTNNVEWIDADHINRLQEEVVALAANLRAAFPASTAAIGGQLKFPASQNASADANTLDDYEEGTYTPTWSASGGSPLPSIGNGTLTGTYVKIGQLVIVSVLLTGGSTTVWGTNSDAWTMTLPFQAANVSGLGYFGAGVAGDAGVSSYPLIVTCAANATTVRFLKTTTGVSGNFTANDPFAWGTGDSLQFTLVYRASA